MGQHDQAARTLIAPLKLLLFVAAAFVLIAGIQLFVLTTATDRFFAWTIASPMTAAFLGASYLASCLLELFAARQTYWHRARPGLLSVLTFTSLTTLVTILHIDRFHFDAAEPTAVAAAWAWTLVYLAVPPLLAAALWLQNKSPGIDPPGSDDLPRAIVIVLYAQAAVFATLGLIALIAPERLASLWPWELTPLTGRAIGAWLIALTVAAVEVAEANDVEDVQGFARAYAALDALQLGALARYGDALDWNGPAAWIYVTFVVGVLATGAAILVAKPRRLGAARPA